MALGIVGGMGPRASARFVMSVYAHNTAEREQDLPRVLLDSDPAFPDRTAAIRAGRTSGIVDRLSLRLHGLLATGATRAVIPCVTAHHFLPRLDPALSGRVISLVDTVVSELRATGERFLLLSTSGTRQAGVFPSAPGWSEVDSRVELLGPDDQELLHGLIYRMKGFGAVPDAMSTVDELAGRYGCAGVILGCTELHLISDELVARYGPDRVVDPLRSIAINLSVLLAGDSAIVLRAS